MAMSNAKLGERNPLKVKRSFIRSRLEGEFIASAYEILVPNQTSRQKKENPGSSISVKMANGA